MQPIPANTVGGCNYWNSWAVNISNCDDTSTFDPDSCFDCSTEDWSNYTGWNAGFVTAAYNLGLANNQAYGILDGNSVFCVEVCQSNTTSPSSGYGYPCDCCGPLHGCEDLNVNNSSVGGFQGYNPGFGCWACDAQGNNYGTCNPVSSAANYFANINPTGNLYNTEPDCTAQSATNCPPILTGCANDPNWCQTNPMADPGGPCWFCKTPGDECMPIYDYLQYGSGPPINASQYMSWLMPSGGKWLAPGGPYPQNYSDLYCTEAACIADGCVGWGTNIARPPTGNDTGDDLEMGKEIDILKPKEKEKEELQEGIQIKGNLLDKVRMASLAGIKKNKK